VRRICAFQSAGALLTFIPETGNSVLYYIDSFPIFLNQIPPNFKISKDPLPVSLTSDRDAEGNPRYKMFFAAYCHALIHFLERVCLIFSATFDRLSYSLWRATDVKSPNAVSGCYCSFLSKDRVTRIANYRSEESSSPTETESASSSHWDVNNAMRYNFKSQSIGRWCMPLNCQCHFGPRVFSP
jgi:hypothetical protein